MAEDKADKALSQAFLTKTYYTGNSPAESGYVLTDIQKLDDEHLPWLFKWYTDENICQQFVNAHSIYHEISMELSPILDLAIVNTKQREAMDETIDKVLRRILLQDKAHEGDEIA